MDCALAQCAWRNAEKLEPEWNCLPNKIGCLFISTDESSVHEDAFRRRANQMFAINVQTWLHAPTHISIQCIRCTHDARVWAKDLASTIDTIFGSLSLLAQSPSTTRLYNTALSHILCGNSAEECCLFDQVNVCAQCAFSLASLVANGPNETSHWHKQPHIRKQCEKLGERQRDNRRKMHIAFYVLRKVKRSMFIRDSRTSKHNKPRRWTASQCRCSYNVKPR